MAIQVQGRVQKPVKQEKPERDIFDKIMLGLQAANGVLGIKGQIEQSEMRDFQMKRQTQQDELALEQRNQLTTPQQLDFLSRGGSISTGDEGPMPSDAVPFQTPGGEQMFARAPDLRPGPPPKLRTTKTVTDGRDVEITYDPMTGEKYSEVDLGPSIKGEDRKEKAFEKDIQKATKVLTDNRNSLSSIDDVERALGFDLEDYDKDTETITKLDEQGNPVRVKYDAPGFNVPFFGRVTAHSGDARELQGKMAKIFNIELKDRSGAAVTTTELNRLKDEYQQGKFNTESEMIGAMQDYKRAAIRAMRDVESGFRPEVIAEIRERGGSTSKDFETRQDPGQIERGGDGTALGGTGGDFSQEDLQAIKFARDHPNDPRSEEILRSLGLK